MIGRSRWAVVAALAIGMLSAPTASSASPPRPEVTPAALRLFMVSDSVGLGAVGPLRQAFSGWQVTITGEPGLFTEQLTTKYVQPQPLSVFGDSAIVATGYNYPYWDPPRFARSVDQMVATLLAKGVQRVFWVTFREVKPQYYSSWNSLSATYKTLYSAYPSANDQLRAALGRHPEMSLIDWASIADQTGLTYDAIHLNPTGASKYAYLAANTVYTASSRQAAGTITELTVAGEHGVPADAVAVSLNLTEVNPRTTGYVTAYPCGGDRPIVSNLNYRAAQTVGSAAVVPIGVDGKVCVFQSTPGHVIVDLNGAFGADSTFAAITPQRAIDTRDTTVPTAGQVTTVHLGALAGVPAAPFTAVASLTTLAGASGDTRIFTCGTTPPASPSRSYDVGFVQNLTQFVATDANGDVCVTTSGNAHVIVDLFGAFPTEADIHPITAQRIVDTRIAGGVLSPGVPRTLQITGSAGVPGNPMPTGALLTLTLVSPASNGFATAYPCSAGTPSTAVLNVLPNHTQTNSVVAGVDAVGTVCVMSNISTQLVVDISGWTGTVFGTIAPARLFDSRL